MAEVGEEKTATAPSLLPPELSRLASELEREGVLTVEEKDALRSSLAVREEKVTAIAAALRSTGTGEQVDGEQASVAEERADLLADLHSVIDAKPGEPPAFVPLLRQTSALERKGVIDGHTKRRIQSGLRKGEKRTVRAMEHYRHEAETDVSSADSFLRALVSKAEAAVARRRAAAAGGGGGGGGSAGSSHRPTGSTKRKTSEGKAKRTKRPLRKEFKLWRRALFAAQPTRPLSVDACKRDMAALLSSGLLNLGNLLERENPMRESLLRGALSVASSSPHFVLTLASWCRQRLAMADCSNFILAVACHLKPCRALLADYFQPLVKSPEDIVAIVRSFRSIPNSRNQPRSLPYALRRAITRRFAAFNEQQILRGCPASRSRRSHGRRRLALKVRHYVPEELKETEVDYSMRHILGELHVKQPVKLVRLVMDRRFATQRRKELPFDPRTWKQRLSSEVNSVGLWEDMLDTGVLSWWDLLRNIRRFFQVRLPESYHLLVQRRLASAAEVEAAQPSLRALANAYRAVCKPVTSHSGYKKYHFRKDRFYAPVVELSWEGALNRYKAALECAAQVVMAQSPPLEGTTVVLMDARGGTRAELQDVAIQTAVAAEHSRDSAMFVVYRAAVHRFRKPHETCGLLELIEVLTAFARRAPPVTKPEHMECEHILYRLKRKMMPFQPRRLMLVGTALIWTEEAVEQLVQMLADVRHLQATPLDCHVIETAGKSSVQLHGAGDYTIHAASPWQLRLLADDDDGLLHDISRCAEEYGWPMAAGGGHGSAGGDEADEPADAATGSDKEEEKEDSEHGSKE